MTLPSSQPTSTSPSAATAPPGEPSAPASSGPNGPAGAWQGTTGGPTSLTLIEADEAAGVLDDDTALRYRFYATFVDARLPAKYRSAEPLLDTDAFRLALARWSDLSSATQQEILPYFLPPFPTRTTPARETLTGHMASLNNPGQPERDVSDADCLGREGGLEPLAPQPYDVPADLATTLTDHFRIWYDPGDAFGSIGAQNLAGIAETIWETETALFREPLSNIGHACGSEDGRYDIALLPFTTNQWDGTGAMALTIGFPPACEQTPSWMLMQPRVAADPQLARATLAHEFFHAIAFGYDLEKDCGSYLWLDEATASWAIDYVYPDEVGNWEHRFAGHYFRDGHKSSLQYNGSYNGYEDYVFFLYLARALGTPVIADIWLGTELYDSVNAVDRAIDGGFDEVWDDFALANWNREPVGQYAQWDDMTIGVAQGPEGDDQVAWEQGEHHWELEGQPVREFEMSEWVKQASWSDRPVFDPLMAWYPATWMFSSNDIRHIRIENVLWDADGGGAHGRVQAVVELADGSSYVEDWTAEPVVELCRDVPQQDVASIQLIYSYGLPRDDEPFAVGNLQLDGDQRMTLSATCPVGYRIEGSLVGDFPDVPNTTLTFAGVADQVDPENPSTITGEGTMSGTTIDFCYASGDLETKQVQVSYEADFSVSISGDEITASVFPRESAFTFVLGRFSGALPLEGGTSLEFEAYEEFETAGINCGRPGTIAVEFKVTRLGALPQP